MPKISLALSTLYSDLAQRVHSRALRAGSPFVMNVKGRAYAYVKRQIGSTRRDDYVGPVDDAKAQAQIELIRQAQEQEKQDRQTIRLLVRSGIPAPSKELGRVLDALSEAGIFADATLIGTAAYQCYSPIIGHELPSPTLTTGDADLATARLAIRSLPEGETILDVLRRAEPTFAPVHALSNRKAPSSAFRARDGFMVDLVPQQRTRRDPNPIPIEGAGAVPLQFVRWLITDPITAVALFGTGVAVRIPQPARFAIHKLILAQERRDDQRAKRRKDLLQARALVEALRESDPYALADAYDDASGQGKRGWAKKIERSLSELQISVAEIIG
ncbi:MAG: GSU2403 family nucleotidyltransferase fold protein [Bauldia sp.]